MVSAVPAPLQCDECGEPIEPPDSPCRVWLQDVGRFLTHSRCMLPLMNRGTRPSR